MATAVAPLPPDHVKAIDTLRSRLAQLSTSITLLKQQLESNETLPPWSLLQQNAASVEYNLRKVGETLTAHQQVFTTAHAYPLPSFPGTTQEHVLQMLLRKKLEPRAEDWIEDALRQNSSLASEQGSTALSPPELTSLWSWAATMSSDLARQLEEADVFRDNFTIDERSSGIQHVVTGIRRNLSRDEDDEDDEDDQDESEADGVNGVAVAPPTQAPMPLASLLVFASTGDLPRPAR